MPDLVSIIILAYSDDRYSDTQYLEEAVASAKAQTYPNVEVIVMDGGGSEIIQCASADTLARVTPNRGVCATLNVGVALAKGEWIVPLNADDMLDPYFVEKCMKALKEQKGEIAILTDVPFTKAILQDNTVKYCCLSSKFFWFRTGGFVPPIASKASTTCDLADWDYWIRLWEYYGEDMEPIVTMPTNLFIYRDRPDSASKWKAGEFEQMRAELWRQHGYISTYS